MAPSRDLVGTPLLPQQPKDVAPGGGGEAAVAPRMTPPGAGPHVGLRRAVRTIAAPIAAELPIDRAAVTAEGARDARPADPRAPQCKKVIPFFEGNLGVGHGNLTFPPE